MPHKIKFSQCMIVKNEEENIARALSWGRGVVSQQIVVDTGSADRTMDIAKSLGARVYQFPWTGDFSEAKNFALEKAGGDWIFFLDADEYFKEGDAQKLRYVIEQVQGLQGGQGVDAFRFTILNVNDSGNVFSISKQDRLFRNTKNLRFQNRIHENLYRTDGKKISMVEINKDVPIYHTGYSKRVYEKTQKAKRNIDLLLKELESRPGEAHLWCYLGDAYLADNQMGQAKKAYWKALSAPEGEIEPERRLEAVSGYLRLSAEQGGADEEGVREAAGWYESSGRESADVEYWLGIYWAKNHNPRESIIHLEKVLGHLEKNTAVSVYLMKQSARIYGVLMDACLQTDNRISAVKYAALALKFNKYEKTVLNTLLILFRDQKEKPEDVVRFLSKIYEPDNLKDKIFLLTCAKAIGFMELYEGLLDLLTEDEKKCYLEIY